MALYMPCSQKKGKIVAGLPDGLRSGKLLSMQAVRFPIGHPFTTLRGKSKAGV
jgi:hypothetical protein